MTATAEVRIEGRELIMERAFDAPRELVFEAWTTCEHLAHWWGPHGFTLPYCEIDLRPGGGYRFVQHDQDGNAFGFRGEYREVLPPERLVYTFIFEMMPDSEAVVTLDFADRDEGRTLLTARTAFDSEEELRGAVESGMAQGMLESAERLDDRLRTIA